MRSVQLIPEITPVLYNEANRYFSLAVVQLRFKVFPQADKLVRELHRVTNEFGLDLVILPKAGEKALPVPYPSVVRNSPQSRALASAREQVQSIECLATVRVTVVIQLQRTRVRRRRPSSFTSSLSDTPEINESSSCPTHTYTADWQNH